MILGVKPNAGHGTACIVLTFEAGNVRYRMVRACDRSRVRVHYATQGS